MSLDIGFVSQTPSLPGGPTGGGLGETFAPDLSTGTGTLAVPFDLPNGPNDTSPKLTLRYDSGSPNGPFGVGWTIALPRVLRSTTVGRPRYDDTDTLVLEGSGPLVRLPDGSLRPQVETGDWSIAASDGGYVATDRAGTRFHLGSTHDSRLYGPGGTWAWLLHATEDNLGYLTTFSWRGVDAQQYLDKIAWGPFELRFGYEPRPDVLRWGRGGFLLTTDERCSSVELHLPSASTTIVRRWDLHYDQSPLNGASLLTSVRMTGFAGDGSSLVAAPLTLSYTTPAPPTIHRIDPEDERSAPPALTANGRVELVDWTGTGTGDVVEFAAGGAARVWPNHAGRWGRPQSVGDFPALAPATSRSGLIDVDGDGLADVVRTDVPLFRYQPRTPTGLGRPISTSRAPAVAPGAPNVRLTDFDGDGRADLLWSSGRALLLAHRVDDGGWLATPDVFEPTLAGPPANLADPHVFCADMTGDGTPDIVRVDGGGVAYWPYLGYGSFGERVTMTNPPELPFDCNPASVYVVDIDGDGCADVVHLDQGALTWWPNRSGCAFEEPRVIEHLPTGAITTLRIADVLGRGTPALCWTAALGSGRGRWFALDLLGTQPTSLLTRVDNGSGRVTDVTWSTSALEAERDRAAGTPWPSRLPLVLPVVSSVAISDASTGPVNTTTYAYHDGRYDGMLREVCGYGKVTSDDLGDASVGTLVTTQWFSVGLNDDGTEPATTDERIRRRSIRGRLLRQDRADVGGYLFDRFEQEWRIDDGTAGLTVTPRLVRSTKSVHEGQDSPVSSIVTEQLAWDPDGNVTQARERGFDGASTTATHELRTDCAFAHDPTGRFRQRLWRVTQRDGTGTVVSDLVTSYDGLPPGQVGAAGLVTDRVALALTDELVTAIYGADVPDFATAGYVQPADEAGWWVQLGRYQRTIDANGMHGQVTGPLGGQTSLDFDPNQCFPVRVLDALGNELRAEFDLRSYQATAVTDPSGGRSEAVFDALARLIQVVEPGDTAADPTRTMSYDTSVLPLVVTATLATAPGANRRVERQFVDGGGRVIEQRIRDESGEIITVSTVYGPRGLPVRVYLPRRATSAAYVAPDEASPHASVVYDAIGRPVETILPDGSSSSIRYLPGVTEERDAEQNRTDAEATHRAGYTRRYLDATGKVVRLEQGVGAKTVTSSDRYDIKGELDEHVDANGNKTTVDRDLLGRNVRVIRPESTQVLVVDPAGNVLETRTGSAQVFHSYDLGSRPVAVRHDTPTSAPVAQFTYHDSGAPAPADAGTHTAGGRLVRIDDESGVTILDYDGRGRIAHKEMQTIGGLTLTIELAYRSDQLVDQIVLPGGRTVAYSYNAVGGLAAVSGVIDAIDYDLSGRRTHVAYTNQVEEHHDHDPLTGWRRSSVLSGPTGLHRQVSYTHDRAGNVTALTSDDPALTWSYGYDDAYRLVTATSGAATASYTYDDAFNLESNSNAGAYGYGAGGAPATCLTSVGTEAYTYDDRGNVVSAPWGAHTVDAQGRLLSIALSGGGTETMVYDAYGRLARKTTTTASGAVRDVLSPDRFVTIEDGQVVLQISDGDRIVAREGAEGRHWLHYDHLGSLVTITDDAGTAILELTYDPFGQVLTRNGTGVAPQGFATGEDVGHGLVLLGARWYSPHLGRFLSPDPMVTDASDPAAWNAYAYCRCNPVSYVDPSGRDFWKIFGAIVATIAIIVVAVVVTVVTFGTATPGTVALAVGGVSITWGAVFAATAVGIVAGGVIGGIAAARAGGDAGDIFLGIVVGGAVGGWAAFGGAFAGVAVAGALGLTSGTIACGAVIGAVSGTINGAAMGFSSGFAGGRNNGLKDIMLNVLVGAVTGLVIGAALGALSGVVAPKDSVGNALGKAMQPDPPPPGAGAPGMPAPPSLTGPPPPVNSLPAAAGQVGVGLAGRAAGAVLPYVGAALARAAGNAFVFSILVDGSSAALSEEFDDLQMYLQTHSVNLGPFNFIKSDF
jgi:RHS repeat-associated protein